MTTNSKEYARAYYQKNRDKLRAAQREYHQRMKEKSKGYCGARLFDMREDFKSTVKADFQSISQPTLTYQQQYYAANRDRIRAQQKESRERKKRLQKQRDYYAANRERILEQQRGYQRKIAKEKRMSKTRYGRAYLWVKNLFK